MTEIVQENSKRWTLNKKDGLKILKGAGIAVGAALITYIAEIIPHVDLGVYTAAFVAVSGVALNTARKLLADFKE